VLEGYFEQFLTGPPTYEYVGWAENAQNIRRVKLNSRNEIGKCVQGHFEHILPGPTVSHSQGRRIRHGLETAGQCSPRHQAHLEPLFLELWDCWIVLASCHVTRRVFNPRFSVIGWQSTQERSVQDALDDVASTIQRPLPRVGPVVGVLGVKREICGRFMYFFQNDCVAVRRGVHRVGPDRCYSPRHRMPFDSRNEGSKLVSMTWRILGLADITRHVIGCHLTQETRVQRVSMT